jgi:hypothetical protein
MDAMKKLRRFKRRTHRALPPAAVTAPRARSVVHEAIPENKNQRYLENLRGKYLPSQSTV